MARRRTQSESPDPAAEPAQSDGRPFIECRGVHVDFGRQKVLRDINLTIPRGQTVALIGESGCGKTVLLKTIISLVRPTQGEALFDGQNLARLGERELTAQRIRFGFLFQNAALFDSMTVGQNVAFPLRQHRPTALRQVEQQVLERLAEVGLPDSVVAKKPAELSGGMRKRVGLARALILEPELMLYDEPTTGLDPIMSDVINELILRTRRQHTVTSLVVTHDMNTARKVADRVIMVYPVPRLEPDEPQVIFDGPPEAIDDSPDRRVTQFVRGEAGERLMEMRAEGAIAE
jgi:phospholipid/cholesterol/gamma-HCH transport system ATP-binding protein